MTVNPEFFAFQSAQTFIIDLCILVEPYFMVFDTMYALSNVK